MSREVEVLIFKHVLRLLPVLSVMLLTGCGDEAVARQRLQQECSVLARQYTTLEISRQVAANPQSKAFAMAPGTLLLVNFDGLEVFPADIGYKDVLSFSIARFYVAQELELLVESMICGKIIPIKHERFTYRSLLELKLREKRRIWRHEPGVIFTYAKLRSQADTEAMKNELLAEAVPLLNDENADLRALYQTAGEKQERIYDMSFFVCYDPALPGWVLEENIEELNTGKLLPADWLQSSAPQYSSKVTNYAGAWYWKKSAELKKKLDNGLRFYDNRWLKAAVVEAMIRLDKLVKTFDPERATMAELDVFLRKLQLFPEEVDRQRACELAEQCARKLILQWRNENKYEDLIRFQRSMQDDPAFRILEKNIGKVCLNASDVVKRRHNSLLVEDINAINAAVENIKNALLDAEINTKKMNVVLTRERNELEKLCPESVSQLKVILTKLHFGQLLMRNELNEANKLYKTPQAEMLKALEPELLKDCRECVNGMQTCFYCRELNGKCQKCRGLMIINDDICHTCHGTGVCNTCRGKRRIRCLNCAGYGFWVKKTAAGEFFRKTLEAFDFEIQGNIRLREQRKIQ